jgi:von Willebrand factor type A domain
VPVSSLRHDSNRSVTPQAQGDVGGTANTKTLHVQPSRPEPSAPSSGLDELADVVASSGLTSRRLRHHAQDASPEAPPARKRNLLFPIIAGALIILVGAGVAWFALRGSSSSSSPAKMQATAAQAAREPAFCEVKLDVPSVAYVIDRGDATRELFGYLKEACLSSINSLGSDRKFQVVFWNNGADDGYPRGGLIYATKDAIQACRVALDEISASGQTDVTSALTKAVNSNPGAIILATAKAWQLDDSFTDTVLKIRGDKPIKIHTFAIGDGGNSAPLRDIAAKTGGEFKVVTGAELRAASQ